MKTDGPSHIALDNFWPYHAVVLADLVSRFTHSVVRAEAGLNISQWRVLAAVADKPGRTAAEVTNITPMDKTIVSRAVSSLIDAGLIQKQPSTTDRRRLSLRTTPAGQDKYEKVALRLNAAMTGALGDVGEDQDFIRQIKKASAKMRLLSKDNGGGFSA